MKIAVIGAGSVGGTLGNRWAALGHEVTFGVRDPKEGRILERIAAGGGKAVAATPLEAARGAEVIVLATPFSAAEEAIRACGDLAGKVLLDCTNPLKPDLSGLEVGLTTSGAERIQGWAKGARVVKAFNTMGFEVMADPRYGERGAAAMFVAADDEGAKAAASTLARELGFEPEDAGPLSCARYLEPMAALWVHMAVKGRQGRAFAFHVLRRGSGAS